MENQPLSVINKPLVSARDGKCFCTSLMIAEKFGKEHANVLKAIRNEMATLPEDFNAVNFNAVNYIDAKGESRPMFELTRDGFSLIVMGFTGAAAQAWKLAFINAFNQMEEQLRQREVIIEKPQTLPPTAYEKFQIMRDTLALAYDGNQLVLAVDKVCVSLTGESALRVAEAQLIAPQQQQLYTPTEIGKSIEPPCSAVKVNKCLKEMGWQVRVNDKWEAVGDGVAYAVYLDTGKAHSDGTPIRQMKWVADVIFAIQSYLNKD